MSQVVALGRARHARPLALGAAIAEFLVAGDFQPSAAEVYERTLEGLLEDLGADAALERISRSASRPTCATATAPRRPCVTCGTMFRRK